MKFLFGNTQLLELCLVDLNQVVVCLVEFLHWSDGSEAREAALVA